MTTAMLACLYLLPIIGIFAVLAWLSDTIEVWEKRQGDEHAAEYWPQQTTNEKRNAP